MAEYKKTKVKVCVICGTLFYSMHSYAKYCSSKCSIKAHHAQERAKKPPIEKRHCKACGKEFLGSCRYQIYCSVECRDKYQTINNYQWYTNNEERCRALKKIYIQRPEVKQKKREVSKKENDAAREESILEGVYKTPYTQEEDNYLLVCWHKLTKKELASALNRTISSVQSRYKKLQKYT